MEKRFFVRVELHDVQEADIAGAYNTLHEEMGKRGFEQVIALGGRRKQLPAGTYIGLAVDTGGDRESAGKHVKAAANETTYSSSFVIVETTEGLQTSGLKNTV